MTTSYSEHMWNAHGIMVNEPVCEVCRPMNKPKPTDEEIARDAAVEIECLVFDADRAITNWERIILSAIKKAKE